MILCNYTPFPLLYFESRDVQGNEFGVFVLRGTFDIVSGAPLQLRHEQQPIVEKDDYYGDIGTSSLYVESDIIPYKPRADIHIHAVACAPGGRPLPDWLVSVKVGSREKQLRVTGPRSWVKQDGTYRLTDPEPVLEVPVRYERAFGGVCKSNWGQTFVYEENPVGLGFVCGDAFPDVIPAPQIESRDDPITEFGKRYRPEAFGPIARSWLPRRKLAGIFDQDWQTTRWPELPLDFDPGFYNCAHPDLICSSYLMGSEHIHLEGLHSTPITFEMFNKTILLLAHLHNRRTGATVFVADTLMIDMVQTCAYLTWRARVSKSFIIESVDLIMKDFRGGARG